MNRTRTVVGILVLAALVVFSPFGLLAGTAGKVTLEKLVSAVEAQLNLAPRSPDGTSGEPSVKKDNASPLEAVATAQAVVAPVEMDGPEVNSDVDSDALRAAAFEAYARIESGGTFTAADKAAIEAYEQAEGIGTPSRVHVPGSLDENGGATFVYGGPMLRIPPSGAASDTVRASITVSGIGARTLDVEVQIDSLTHQYDADLKIYLRGPTGVRKPLALSRGSSGDNYIRTLFDDEAGTPIASGTAPFTGSFRPDTALSAFDNLNPNGVWTLLIVDTYTSGDTGAVYSWRLQISTINTGLAHNFAVGTVYSPTAGPYDLGVSVNVAVRFTNYGTTMESAPLNYRLGTGAVVTETSLTLPQYGNDDHNFIAPIVLPSTPGVYPLTIWSALPGDAEPVNDTARLNITVRGGTTCATAVLLAGARDSALFNNCGAGNTTPGQTCGASGQDLVYYMVVPPGNDAAIWQSFNTLDSRHSLAWGGACPGTNVVGCTDTDLLRYAWRNTTGVDQNVWFVVGANSLTGACGDFRLQWSNAPCANRTPPYFETFDAFAAPSLPECWSVENTNAIAPVWETYSSSYHSSPNSASISGAAAGNDDWFFTPGLNFAAGQAYTFVFWRRGYSSSVPESLEVSLGTSASAAGMTQPLLPVYTIQSTTWAVDSLLIPAQPAGVYFIGFHNLSKRSACRTYLDDFALYPQGGCGAPTANANNAAGYSAVTLTATASGGYGGPVVYQWYTGGTCDNANRIDGANTTTYVTSTSGTYSVRAYRVDSVTCASCDAAVATILGGDNCADAMILVPPAPGGSVAYGGTTTGATANCPDTCESNFRSYGPDVFYRMTLAQCARLSFKLTDSTGTGGDMHLSVYDGLANCCGTAILCNEDKGHFPLPEWANSSQLPSSTLGSFAAGELPAGEYYIRVARYTSGVGTYMLTVYDNGPCPGAAPECAGGDLFEAAEDRFNRYFRTTDPDGGCNNTTPVFGALPCNQTLCGVGFNYQNHDSSNNCFRDTDWHSFTISETRNVMLTVTSGFKALTSIVDISACPSPLTVWSDTAQPLVPRVFLGQVNPGTYSVYIAPAFNTGNPFPTQYRAELICAPLCEPHQATDLTVTYAAPDSIILRWTAPILYSGTYTIYTHTSPDDFPTSWTVLATGVAPVAPPEQVVYVHTGSVSVSTRRIYVVTGVCPDTAPPAQGANK